MFCSGLLTAWRILRCMGVTVAVPAWVQPAPRQVVDCHRIATAFARGDRDRDVYDAVERTLGWVLTAHPDRPAVEREWRELATGDTSRTGDAMANTLAWLMGVRGCPLQLPRRHDDGTLVTAGQLYAEYMRGKDQPEERREARIAADRDARRYQWLAEVAANA